MKTLITKTLIVFAVLFANFNLSAQTISSKVVEDNPDTKNLYIAFNILDISAYSANMSLGFNAYASATLANRFQLDFDIRKAWNDDGIGIFSPQDLTKNFHIRAGGQLYLSSKIKRANTRVVLSSYSSGKYTHTTFINTPANKRKIFAVRGGLQYFYNNCRTDNGAGNSRAANDNDMKAKLNGKVQLLSDPVNFETVNYTVNTMGIYAGLGYKTIVNLILDVEGWGRKGNSSSNDFYADVLFAPLVSYAVKPNQKQAYLADADLNISENKKAYLGWRVGWQAYMGKKIMFSVKTEVGQQPGNGFETFFMNIGLGIGFGTKILSFK